MVRIPKAPVDAKTKARMRQPMPRGDVHALMQQTLSIVLNSMNELEGRIQALEPPGERKTPSGLVLPSSMGDGSMQ